MADSFVKAPFYQSAKFLNDTNDSVAGGTVTAAPSGVVISQFQQNIPGDRIILDDATALALSDTAVGTLLGGIYMYCTTPASSTAVAAVGSLAYFRPADLSVVGAAYIAAPDAQPLTTLPTYFLGVFINAISKGFSGWVQVMGIASVLFDSTVTSTVAGNMVIAKASASVASTADNITTTNPTAPVLAAAIGIALGTTATSTIAKVAITRGLARL